MRKERELLGRVLEGDHGGDFFITNRLLKEIQTLLTQPEQNNTQYLLEQVSRLTAENAMLKEKWLSKGDDDDEDEYINEESGYNRSDWWG